MEPRNRAIKRRKRYSAAGTQNGPTPNDPGDLVRAFEKWVNFFLTEWGPSCVHFLRDLTVDIGDMWSIVLTSLRLRTRQPVEPPLVEAVATVENADKLKEKKKKSEMARMNAFRRKRLLKSLKVTQEENNVVESNEGRLTRSYDGDETWDGHHREETNEEHMTVPRSNTDLGHEFFGPVANTANNVVVEERDLSAPSAPASLERQESQQSSSSSSPSSRIPPPTRLGQSRRQRKNARKREQKKGLGGRTEKGKRSDAKKKKEATEGQVEESRPADDSEMPENGSVDHVDDSEIPENGAVDHVDDPEMPENGSVDHVDDSEIPENGAVDHVDDPKMPENGAVDHVDDPEMPENVVVDHIELTEEEVVPSSHYPLVSSMYATSDHDRMLYHDILNCTVKDEDTRFRHGFPRRDRVYPGLDVLQFTAEPTPLKRVMSNPSSTQSPFTPGAAKTEFLLRDNVGYENLNDSTVNGNWQYPPALISRPLWEGDKRCCRCGVTFRMTETGEQFAYPSLCIYHWDNKGLQVYYKCCFKRVNEAPGCSRERYHVFQHKVVGVERLPHPHGFISTTNSKNKGKGKASRDVVSLDCEMVYTVAGLKLAQVVVLDVKGFVIYSTYVRPLERIYSYNTEHSGVKKEHLEGPEAKTLQEVQKELLNSVINNSTIIIGHALHNDLKVLQLLHNLIVDTKILYGYTGIKRLSALSSIFLNREIQKSFGHDCAEDARAALDLALRFVCESKQGSKENIKTK